MASINDYQVVKVIQNPIIPHRVVYSVTNDKFNTDLCTDYVPRVLSLQEGLWQYKINNVYVDNFLTKNQEPLPSFVFDIKTNLNRSYEKYLQIIEDKTISSFQSFYTTIMTVAVCSNERFCYVPNANSCWYEVSARPYSNFQTRFDLKNGLKVPSNQTLRIEIEYLFQRVK